MDNPRRDRSPSQGHQPHISPHTSPSPHQSYQNIAGLGLDANSLTPDNSAFASTTFDSSNTGQGYLSPTHQQQFSSQSDITNHTFLQAQGLPSNQPSPQFGAQGNNIYSQDLFTTGADNQAFDAQFLTSGTGNQGSSVDPSVFLDPQLQDHSIDPSSLMNHQMSATAHSPTPPHLLQADMSRHASASPHASPSINQGGFHSAGHSRQQSLDPSTAYGQGHGGDWNGMSFRGHRRAPSDTYSDVSSNHPSPYLGNNDSFDHDNPSPLLGATQDNSMFQEVLNFGQFSLSDNHSQAGITPGHSPHISPRLAPQQQNLPPFTASNNYGLTPVMSNQPVSQSGMDMFPGSGQEPFPALNQEYGASDQMSPPEINIDFAPPSRQQSFEPPKPEGSENALSPPNRSLSRNRMRARSDPFSSASTRASTPASGNTSDPSASLHPNTAKLPASRSSSPHGLNRSSRRSSTSSIPHRDYMLGLADPNRPNPNNPSSTTSSPGASSDHVVNPSPGGSKRTQKHPATFQCSLCPKRFTRAYNLRSHLRTHTDERPFVCSVCGKAFARQHDRKRHEGLHSGEKKFVCRGVLKDGNGWGCGRRFARADALGRHFRSEAGRVCIRPLLEEEAAEKGWDLPGVSSPPQQQTAQPMDQMNPLGAPQQGLGMMMPQHPQSAPFDPFAQQQPPTGFNPGMGGGMSFGLPQALLQQYPALAGIQWDALPPANNNEDLVEDDAISGRSSFDASSGGEMFEEGAEWGQAVSDYEGR